MRDLADVRSPSEPVITLRQVDGFVLREAICPPGYGGTVHRHPTSYLGYVVAGGFTETSRSGRSRYARGSLHFHPSDDPHAAVVGARGARCFNIMPTEPLSGRLDAQVGDLRHRDLPPHLASLADRCHRGFLANDSAADLECEGAALELLAALLRLKSAREAGTPRWLDAAREYLHAHATEPLTVSQVAAASGVHPVHLVRGFRRRLGITPTEYVRQLRLEIACRALAGTDQPIAQVALDAGYSSQSHLTRAFRAHFGVTPARYRHARRPGTRRI